MKKEASPSYASSLPAISARIQELKATYANIISKLIRYYTQTVSDDALDRYMQVDDLKFFNDKDASEKTHDQIWGRHYYDALEVRAPPCNNGSAS